MTRCIAFRPIVALLMLSAAACAEPAGPSGTATPSAHLSAAGPSIETIMTNLNSPRGMAWGPDGGLYVVEAGLNSASGPCATVARGQNCWSGTGSISRYRWGRQERVVEGLPSVFNAAVNDIVGPHDIAFVLGHYAYVSVGWGGDPAARAQLGGLGDEMGTVLALTVHTGQTRWRVQSDIAAFEGAANPAGGNFDSNPYGILVHHGRVVATDAGGNSLVSAGWFGHTSLVTTFEATPVPPGPFNPPFAQMEAVPTEVKRGPDGALYVSTLRGAPFLPGSAAIYRVVPGQAPAIHAAGFTQIVDFDWRDGVLYVLQYASAPFLNGPGVLIKVARDGTRETIPTTLFHPTGLLAGQGHDRALYVTNNGNLAGVGEVLRIRP